MYISHSLTSQLSEFQEENIPFPPISLPDTLSTIQFFESQFGLFSLLDEESVLPNGSDKGFCEKVYAIQKRDFFKTLRNDKSVGGTFHILHYCGPCVYSTDDFLAKNQDTIHLHLLVKHFFLLKERIIILNANSRFSVFEIFFSFLLEHDVNNKKPFHKRNHIQA